MKPSGTTQCRPCLLTKPRGLAVYSKFCDSCGREVMSSIRYCPTCGCRNFSQLAPNGQSATSPGVTQTVAPVINPKGSQSPTHSSPTNGANIILPGIHGWLKFFCISLTILTPLLNIGFMLKEWQDLSDFPPLKNAVMLWITCYSAVTFFSVFAGTKLWTQRPNAVKIAKYYLITQLLAALLLPWIVFTTIAMPDLFLATLNDAIKTGIGGVIYFVIWYSFLCKSKRVKATFV